MTIPGLPCVPKLRVVVLPNTPWTPAVQAFLPGNAPDPDRLRRLLAERGIDLVVVDPFQPPLNPLGRGHPFFAGLDPLRALVILLRHRTVDLVISVFESGAVVPLLLRRLFLFKPRLVLWDVSVGSTWRPRRLALRYVLPRIDHAFLLSRWQKLATERNYKTRHPTDVIGYAVDEDFYHPRFSSDGDCILSVGDDTARDYSTMVAAVQDLAVKIVLKTNSLPDTVGSQGTISIIRERLSFVRLRALYASAMIVVVPLRLSDHPSGITSLYEAMAMGKAIIASDVPMVREIVADGETGLIVPVANAAKMRDAITFLLERTDERRRLGQNARLHLEANLGMVSFANRYAACIRNVVRVAPALKVSG